jgi:Domain of unknown function (DUF4389)
LAGVVTLEVQPTYQEGIMRASRVVALVMGCLLVIPSIALLFGGGALGLGYAFGRGDDGYFDTTLDRLDTETVAIIADDITFAAEPGSPDWVLDLLDTDVRIRATGADASEEIFLGIARQADVDGYLAGVAHDEVVDLTDDLEPVFRARTGATADAADVVALEPPADQTFWAATAVGPGTQELEWEAASGRWAVVAMNADATPGVAVDVNVGITAGFVLPLALTMLGLGVLLTALAVTLIVVGARDVRRPGEPGPGPTAGETGPPELGRQAADREPAVDRHPVSLTARLDPELSRWQWLVKWVLAIPHAIVLVFLWIAFVVLTVVAGVAIVFTGRYPRGIFDFNVGVLRWTWRVSYYASTGGIGTDRYPPFSLRPEPGDPARLDVAYPERLSRGMVFVKWFLAIPHLVLIGLLAGSSIRWFGEDGDRVGFDVASGGGVLGLLVVVAGIVLLFRGRYPTALFDLIIGFNRWIYRTIAYVALMTDTYPPFRLDQGGDEPRPAPDPPPAPAAGVPFASPPAFDEPGLRPGREDVSV